MSVITGTLTRDGAVIDRLAGVSEARRAALGRLSRPIPAPDDGPGDGGESAGQ